MYQIERLKSKKFAVCSYRSDLSGSSDLLIMDERGEYETINGKQQPMY